MEWVGVEVLIRAGTLLSIGRGKALQKQLISTCLAAVCSRGKEESSGLVGGQGVEFNLLKISKFSNGGNQSRSTTDPFNQRNYQDCFRRESSYNIINLEQSSREQSSSELSGQLATATLISSPHIQNKQGTPGINRRSYVNRAVIIIIAKVRITYSRYS